VGDDSPNFVREDNVGAFFARADRFGLQSRPTSFGRISEFPKEWAVTACDA
jgi:hypothetical protein